MADKRGFTLVELSIVLVIIGLLVGGILVGRDLIKAAEIRSTVSQIEKYNTSVNAFRSKYGYLPGDMPTYVAQRFGFFALTGNPNYFGWGDGNGFLEGGQAGGSGQRHENLLFWRHLTDAQMIDGSYGTASSGNSLVAATGFVTNNVSAGTAGQLWPAAKLGRGNSVMVYGATGSNYYQITGVDCMSTDGYFDCGTGLRLALTPLEAQQIDAKLDDGLPLVGNARAMRHNEFLDMPATAGSLCVTAPGRYDTGAANGETPNCQLRLRMN